MPYSYTTFDATIRQHLVALNPKSILDMGAGAGKYGKLLRDVLPECRIDAVEGSPEVVEQFSLKTIYNTVHTMSIEKYLDECSSNSYDVVILGDVLEHFYRSRAMDYLDFLAYRSGFVACVWPTNMRQDDFAKDGFETHRSNFKLKDLADKFEVVHYEKKFVGWNVDYVHPTQEMHFCVLKGVPSSTNANYPC